MVLGSSRGVCSRQSGVKVGVHQGEAVNKPEGQAPERSTTKQKGDAAEDRALRYLQTQGLQLVQRNYRTPGRGGGEIDLVLLDPDGTLVFVEVRHRARGAHGGALASVSASKQRHLVFAARYFLLKYKQIPPCRFDVVALEGDALHWYKAAFDA
jgi:putative endonuclease